MGITDFASFRQVQAMRDVLEESRGRLHLGVMMNCKTLHGIETMTKNQQLSKLVEASPSCAQEAHPLSILNQSKDPWALGAAVILSAHCTDAAVNKVMDSLLARFPTPESITGARRDDIVPLLPGISHGGNKADYLVNWARHLLRKTSRVAPTIGELTKVKGIGRKTASIILHAAWGLDEGIPLDAHCQRILERIGYSPGTPKPEHAGAGSPGRVFRGPALRAAPHTDLAWPEGMHRARSPMRRLLHKRVLSEQFGAEKQPLGHRIWQ